MPLGWLENLAKAYLALCFLCAFLITGDLLRRPQKMWIMNVVWPVTALYWGPVCLWSYRVMGRPAAGNGGFAAHSSNEKPFWQQTAVGVTHCGAGCTLGDIGGEWLVFSLGWTLFGAAIYAAYFVDFGFAYVLGIIFQYFSIAPMRGLGLKDGIVVAIKADTISLVAFEIGLFAWMALSHFVLFPEQDPANWSYWLMMQVGMIVGFFTSYPANWWLIRNGYKQAM
jgi:hypothetical protein